MTAGWKAYGKILIRRMRESTLVFMVDPLFSRGMNTKNIYSVFVSKNKVLKGKETSRNVEESVHGFEKCLQRILYSEHRYVFQLINSFRSVFELCFYTLTIKYSSTS